MSTSLKQTHWAYQYSKPSSTADFKTQPSDFVVIEELGFEPEGQGEHIFVWVEKTGLNTAFVAEQIAKYTKKPLRQITYAGRKDKHAQTYQWFGVHHPGKEDIDWSDFSLEGCSIKKSQRHNKKLRVGVLKGNRFEIRLRNITSPDHAEERLHQIKLQGVPNYFSEQRFGDTRRHPNGGNLALAEQMIQGEEIRNRNKRSMAISALRSWLFNEVISQRLEKFPHYRPIPGDVFNLLGSNSFFTSDTIDEDIEARLDSADIQLTAPMWGEGELHSRNEANSFETGVVSAFNDVTQCLETLGLKQERRPLRLIPQSLEWIVEGDDLMLSFSLPSGCFATSVLREVAQLHIPQQET